MNTEELELLHDSKYRSYINAVDKALKNFEYSSEWADLISALGKLNKVLQNHSKYQVIPKKMIIGKRLAQCLHPALPSGVHLKALETYDIIFRTIGSKRLARDLFLYSSGLFPLLANAAMSAKPALLQLYEKYYLALGRTLRPGLQGFLIGILPGLEEGSEYYDRTNSLLEKTCAAVEASVFHGALWASVLTSPSVRLPAMTYALSHLNRRQSMEDQLHVIGTDIELMVEAVCVCVQDSIVLVQRSTLDLLLFCFPFYHTQVVKMDMVRILSSALHVVLRRDMSLNRRLYAWLLGCDNNGTHVGPRSPCATTSEERGSHYFNTYSRDFLVQAMISILKWRGTSEEDGTGVQPNLKPFRILLCLLDKPEIGPAILEDVLIEVFRALHTRCECELRIRTSPAFSKDSSGLSSKMREDKKTVEVVKTANLLFSSFEPYYIWDYISRQFQDCCRMSGGGAGRVRRESGLSEQELTVCELCVLTDFLLDIVSLESYIEIQTGHLPRLLLLLVTCMSRYMDSLSLVELSDMLRLCSKILSRVQPPLVPTLVPHGGVDAVSITKAPSIAAGTKGEAPASSTSQNISISALAAATLPETGFSDFVQCRSHRPTGHGTEEVGEEAVDSLGVQNKQQERGHVTQASESNVRDFEVDKGSSNCGSDSKRSSSELRNKEVLDLSHRKNEGETKEEEQEKNEKEKEEEEEEDKMEETKVKEGMIEEGWEALADLTETGKTTMQLCVELFQGFYTQFLCRYVLGNEFVVTNFVSDIALGASNNDGLRNCELWKKADGTAMLPGMKECRKHSQDTDNNVGALTAACQLFLECSSFPVYVAEGSPSSPCHEASSCTEQFPDAVPMWLQSLLACCCLPCHFGPDPFPTQAVAIGCFLDLLNLTHSVSRSTGRVGESGGANSPGMSECSPSHGRVAVLIVPPLAQCHVDIITRDTLFFQRVAEILWVHLAHEVPKHQVCAVDLLQQLHGLASGSAVCEDVISRDLASHITALRVEAHKKFAMLWHLTRDVQRGKATAFTRTFDRSLLLMLESLWTARDNASRSVALSWLRQVIQRHDIPRILEPLLLLLLHPKTQRVALSYAVRRIQPKTSAAIEVGEPGLDKVVTDKWGRNSSNRDGDESTTEMRICVHASTEQGGAVVSEGVRTDTTPPLISVSLRVNPLGSSQSPQSSCESLNDDQENEQPQSTVSNHVGVPPAFQRDEEEVGHVLEVLVDEVSRGIEVEQVSNRSSGEENEEENDELEEEKEESEDCDRECSLTSSECEPSSTASSPERHCGDVEEGEPWQGNILHGLVRPSSLPDLCVHKGSDVVSTSLTPDGTGESAEAWKEGLVDKSRPIVGSHKSTGALDSSPGSGANSAWQVPRGYGGDAASLEAWYIPGEAEGGESFIDDKDERIGDVDGEVDRNIESMNGENHRAQTSVTGLIEQSKGHTFPMVHPLYQHVLLYLQPYDTGRVVHVLTALRAMLYAYPSTFVSAISTTGMSGGSSPRLSWLQDLLTRHHAALSGRDFYTIAPGPVIAQGAGSVGFRSAMYLEVLLSLCLAFLRSHYPSQARASSRDVAENRDVQVLSAELLTIIVSTLARIVETGVGSALVPGGGSVSGSGYANFLVDLLARCKMQRVLLHCLLAGVAVPHLRHKLCAGIITSSKIQVKANEEEESPGNNRPVDILIDESADASGLQTQLLELLQALIVLEYRILSLSEDPDAGFTELCAPESKQQQGQQQQQNSQQAEQHKPRHHQQQRKSSVPLLRYEPSRPITEQEMLGWTVLHALSIQSQSCSAHLCWIAMVTSSLPYLGQVLGRLSVAVTTQLCHNLDAVVAQLEWEVGLCSSRPSVLLQDVPLDYIVFLLEGVTTIVHHCLLDSFPSPNQTQGNSKFLNEARAALLPSLPTVIMTASSLWGLMSLFDSQGAEGAHVMQSGLPAATTINLGSTKILRQKLLALLSPLCLQHGAMFLAAVARVWDGRRQHRAVSRVKATTWASQEQMLLVELVRAIGTLHCDSIVCTVRDVMKQPPGEIAREKHFSLEVCLLQFLFAYIQSVAVNSFVDAWPSLLSLLKDCSQLNLPPPGALLLLGILNDFVLKTPPLESKKDQRDLQDITQRLVEAVATVAGSSLEQTTWLRRNLEVKAGPQVSMDISGQQDVKDILLSPVADMVSSTPSAYSVHALTLLAEVLAHLLDMVFRSDEKEKVVPLLISIMHYVVPYLKNHSTHNAPSYRACVQLLNSLSGYQYTRRAWKKEVFDLFMDPAFFQIEPFCASQWRSIIDHLMTHDKITFRDFMARVVVAQSSSLNNLFSSREAELEQRVVLLKRLAFAIFASELDQYQKLLPDIQERLAESLRLPQMPTLHAQVFVVFRVLLLRISPHHLTSLWPTMITELVQVFMQMEQEMVAEDDLSRNANPSISGLETTYFSGNGYSSSYNQQHWLSLYLSACKFLDLALALPCEHLPQFQLYRWAFITESFDEGGLEVRRQGNHQREFKPYVSRITKLLRKKCKKNCDEDGSWRSLPLEPGLPLLTATSIRSIDHLLPFFNTLCHAFSSHGVRPEPTELCDGDPVVRLSVQPPSTRPERNLGLGPEVPGYWGSRLRKRVEEMVERDFLEPTPGKG